MAQDLLGNEVSLSSSTGLKGVDRFVSGFLSYETQASDVLQAANDDAESFLAQVYAGVLCMFGDSPAAFAEAERYIERALVMKPRANRRELMNFEMLRAWKRNDVPNALDIGYQLIEEFPTDLVALKVHQNFSFNLGDAEGMLRIAQAGLPANQNNAHLHGMLAFAHEQSHQMRDAELAARRAIQLKSNEPWAQHALAHVMLTEGRVPEGLDFLREVSSGWVNLNSFMHTHNWWHMALFEISMGDFEQALRIYDEQCWSQDRTYSEDQVGAISLLTRIELAGGNVGNRWEELGHYIRVRSGDVVQPFMTMQYVYGLAKAGLDEASHLMAEVEQRAARAAPFEKDAWVNVALPSCRGMLAHVQGDFEQVVEQMTPAMPRMLLVGGSHAQRDLFAQILLDAHIKAGHFETARDMLESRRKYDPNGVPLNRALGDIYERLGLLEEASEARARHY